MLVAMPTALVPAGSLPIDPSETDTVGLNTHLELPAVRMSGDGMEQIGVDIGVYVVDLGVDALRAITPLSLVPETEDQGPIGFGEDLDIIPDPTLIVEMVQEWLASTDIGPPSTPRKKVQSRRRFWRLIFRPDRS